MNAVFQFVVHQLRWLIHFPFLPHIFDSMLLTWAAASRPSRLAAMTSLEKATEGEVQLAVHRFGGVEFRTGCGRQLGHVHGHGLLDVRVSRAWSRRLMAAERVYPHHIFPNSGWISFQLETPRDVPFALALLRLAREQLETSLPTQD